MSRVDKITAFFISVFISLVTILPLSLVSLFGVFIREQGENWWVADWWCTISTRVFLNLVLLAVVAGAFIGLIVGLLTRKNRIVCAGFGVVSGLASLGVYCLYAIGCEGSILLFYQDIAILLSLSETLIIGVGVIAYTCLIYRMWVGVKN